MLSDQPKSESDDDFAGSLAKRENTAIRWTRVLVVLVLTCAAAIMAVVAYFVLRNEETNDFHVEFNSLAREVLETSDENIRQVFGILENLSSTATTFIREHKSEGYPAGFLTVPDAEMILGTARSTSGSLLVAYLPFVAGDEYELWGEYSTEKQRWIYEANGNSMLPDPIMPQIWHHPDDTEIKHRRGLSQCSPSRRNLEEEMRIPEEPQNGPFAPVWTFSPPPPPNDTSHINYNMMRKPVYKKAVDFIEYTRKPMFLDVCTQTKWFGESAPDRGEDPQTVIVYPVFEDFTEDSKIVGHLVAVIPWNVFFEKILSDKSKPVTAVLSNTCNEVFSYSIEGSDARFIEEADTHRSSADSLKVEQIFAEFANPKELLDSGLGEHCVYTISIYPSKELEESFNTSKPVVLAVIVLSIFVFTSAVFILYDFLVRRRQAKVLALATKQNAVVSSLFPTSVKNRIIADADSGRQTKNSTGRLGLKDFLAGKDNFEPEEQVTSRNSKPIADLFSETTIMFADIAGFTAWSSTREPSQVFTLLETIYHEFDQIAKQRRVFKIETVGDCYVAVCGIPDARKDHAITMARFARDCLRKMKTVILGLKNELGLETADLALRVGLHSGPVTAGVLRGEKARFQLFGDTMNTASRMESTGIKNKIQLSQDTASLLEAAGKGHWIVRREDKVVAKGKGELTTYFLVTSRPSSMSSSISGSSEFSDDPCDDRRESLHVPPNDQATPSDEQTDEKDVQTAEVQGSFGP
jgi:class 3 adenylate cyclase